MIGQTKIKERLGELMFMGLFPRFSIFVGDTGSGRRTLIHEDLTPLGCIQERAISAESVREVIEEAYSVMTPTIYLFANADAMSLAAENALLKVTEEPPNDVYFVLTVNNPEHVLATIKSRATLFHMDAYNEDELLRYYRRVTIGSDDEIIKKYCTVPGDIDLICKYNPKNFQKYVETVVANIEKVSGANSFKIGSKINLGSDEKLYSLELFFKAFRAECLSRIADDPLKFAHGINITSKYLGQLQSIASINLQMLFDNWLLDVRKAWM